MTNAHDLADKLTTGGTRADARALAHYGAEAIPEIARAMASGWRAGVSVGTALRMVRGPGVVDELVKLTAGRSDLAGWAIGALGHSHQRAALEPLLALFEQRRRVGETAEALGELGMFEAIPALNRYLTSPEIERWLANEAEHDLELWDVALVAGALLRIGDPAGDPLLTRLAATNSLDAARAAVDGLRWSGTDSAVSALAKTMYDGRDEVADAAVDAVGALGLPAVAPTLLVLAEARPPRFPAVWSAFRALFGDGLPDSDAAALAAWWGTEGHRWPRDRHVWWGGEDVGHAISKLPGADGGLARTRLELWTGIDMVDSAEHGASGDHHDMLRAALWWERVPWDWKADAIYRNRRELDRAPILAAIDRAGSETSQHA